MNGGLFAALAIQQTTLFLVIGLIVAVSTFNVVATLVMTVQEKKRDIGVLTTLGAEPRFFSRVFLALGALLGGTGVLFGVVFGVLVCWVMTRFRLLSFPPGVAEIYFVSYIPFLVRLRDSGRDRGLRRPGHPPRVLASGAPRRRRSTSPTRFAMSRSVPVILVSLAVAGCRARPAAPGFRPREVPVSAREDPGERGRPLRQVESGRLQADAGLDLRRRSRPPRGRQGREGRQRRGLGPRALRLEALHLRPHGRGRDQPRRIGRGEGHVRGGPCEGGRRRDGRRPEGERGLEAASVPRLQLRLHQPELRLAASHRSRRRRSRSASSTRRSRRTARSSSTAATRASSTRARTRSTARPAGRTASPAPASAARREPSGGTRRAAGSRRVEIPFRDNPDWNSFKLELEGIELMTPAAWKKSVADSLAKANAKSRGSGRAALRQELLLPPDRLGADRGELGVLADRFEEGIAVHGGRRTGSCRRPPCAGGAAPPRG